MPSIRRLLAQPVCEGPQDVVSLPLPLLVQLLIMRQVLPLLGPLLGYRRIALQSPSHAELQVQQSSALIQQAVRLQLPQLALGVPQGELPRLHLAFSRPQAELRNRQPTSPQRFSVPHPQQFPLKSLPISDFRWQFWRLVPPA